MAAFLLKWDKETMKDRVATQEKMWKKPQHYFMDKSRVNWKRDNSFVHEQHNTNSFQRSTECTVVLNVKNHHKQPILYCFFFIKSGNSVLFRSSRSLKPHLRPSLPVYWYTVLLLGSFLLPPFPPSHALPRDRGGTVFHRGEKKEEEQRPCKLVWMQASMGGKGAYIVYYTSTSRKPLRGP